MLPQECGRPVPLWDGMAALLQGQGRDACPDADDFFGMGQAIKGISKELSILEDILRCGHDSMALTKDK